MNALSRRTFLQNTTLAGAAMLVANLESLAKTTGQKKIKVALIGFGSVSGKYLPHLSQSA